MRDLSCKHFNLLVGPTMFQGDEGPHPSTAEHNQLEPLPVLFAPMPRFTPVVLRIAHRAARFAARGKKLSA